MPLFASIRGETAAKSNKNAEFAQAPAGVWALGANQVLSVAAIGQKTTLRRLLAACSAPTRLSGSTAADLVLATC